MRKILIGLVFKVAMTGAVWAQDVLLPNAGIEGTIQNQIDAFQVDDFAKAFEFASPGIRNIFRTPENFGQMVQRGYPMVWRPDDVRFGDLRMIEGALWQQVIVTDGDGNLHYLDYRMEKISGEWRIAGVQILQKPGVSA